MMIIIIHIVGKELSHYSPCRMSVLKSGEWKVESGEWRMENGEWTMRNLPQTYRFVMVGKDHAKFHFPLSEVYPKQWTTLICSVYIASNP